MRLGSRKHALSKVALGALVSSLSLLFSPSLAYGIDLPLSTYLYDVDNLLRNTQVNESSGAFIHSLLIVAPPGRNGMQPDLSFVYNSQKNEELNAIGYGWDIPIPYIERLNKTGVQDLYDNDLFSSSLSGELATTSDASIFFAKSDDGSFLKYEFASSTNNWTVKSKDGHVYKFGHATSSRIYNQATSTEVFRWMLQEERDANNNYIKYEYYKDSGFIYPSRITYTGNGSTDGIFTVDFNRATRSDNATSTAPGFEIESRYRINEIVVSVNGQWVRKYELAYTTGDNGKRSLLDTITELGRTENGTEQLLPASNFDYEAVTPGWATTTTTFSLPEKVRTSNNDTGLRVADVNGDALVDLILAKSGTSSAVYINDGDSWNYDASWYFPIVFVDSDGEDNGVRLADLNGDGLIDILKGKDEQESLTYLNTGSGWATTTSWSVGFATINGADNGVRLADVNGDGLVDLVSSSYVESSNTKTSSVGLNNGSAFVSAPEWN